MDELRLFHEDYHGQYDRWHYERIPGIRLEGGEITIIEDNTTMYEIPLYEIVANYFYLEALLTSSVMPYDERQSIHARLDEINEYLRAQKIDKNDAFVQQLLRDTSDPVSAYDVAKKYSDNIMQQVDRHVELTDTGIRLVAPTKIVQAIYGEQSHLAFIFLKKI